MMLAAAAMPANCSETRRKWRRSQFFSDWISRACSGVRSASARSISLRVMSLRYMAPPPGLLRQLLELGEARQIAAREGLHQRDQVGLLLLAERERPHASIEIGI